MEQPQQQDQQPELLCPTSTSPQQHHEQPFVRAPSPPKPANGEHLAEVQLLLQSQYTASGAAVATGKVPKSALKKRGGGGERVEGKKKGVVFREFVVVAYTWSPAEYDRTSIQISPITNADLISLYAYRAELEATTKLLTQLRDQAINEQIRQRRLLLQQQQQQKIALAMAAQAARAAVQAAAASYGWNGGMYPQQNPYQFQQPYPMPHHHHHQFNAFPGAGHPLIRAESARWANPIAHH
ncbi:hypothetical protein HK097_001265 [Rhizophlyctis rosea]|uniref:Uncharacterized protein n=1 Tax=Rhizophlyctis rosea TaxID=64517 RepID=A0AAD5S4N1_9FUNG|nr:hypothetical protein HK097_001265 [Rhizophlyctis rosea]